MSRSGWLETGFGWVLSTGIHVVLLLGAALVFMEYLVPIDFAYCGFGIVWTKGDARIEPARGLIDDFDRRRELVDDSLIFSESEGGLPSAPLRPDPWTAERESASDGYRLFDTAAPGTSGPVNCNLEGSWSEKTPSTRSRRQAGIPFGWTGHSQGCPRIVRGCCLESAQIQSLIWLARHQNPDGGWSASGFGFCCDRGSCSGAGDPAFDTGVTGLSLLAFLGAGYTSLSKGQLFDKQDSRRVLLAGEAVKKGLRWLMTRQDAEGCIGPRGPKFLYNHAIATLALSEAYGMTAIQALREPTQRAVDFLVAAQNPGAGWRYGVRDGENDSSVTGWAVMALKSVELSGLTFPQSAYEGAVSWLHQVTSTASGVGYNAPDSGKVFIPGKNEWFEDHPTMSAIGVMSRIFMQRKQPLSALPMAIAADLPSTKSGSVDFYYWYYGSLALFQYDGPSGRTWTRWNEALKPALLQLQKTPKDGCQDGSWDPSLDRWGSEGGRVYATALNTMTFEIYYRYANVFGGKSPR